jgi:hypothetical protein
MAAVLWLEDVYAGKPMLLWINVFTGQSGGARRTRGAQLRGSCHRHQSVHTSQHLGQGHVAAGVPAREAMVVGVVTATVTTATITLTATVITATVTVTPPGTGLGAAYPSDFLSGCILLSGCNNPAVKK